MKTSNNVMIRHGSNRLNIANMPKYGYDYRVHPHGELALTGYKFSLGAQSARAFFVRKISMRPHRYVELGRGTFECAGNLLSLSINPVQPRHPHLIVNGKAPKSKGAH